MERIRSEVSPRWHVCVWALVLAFFLAGVFGRSLWKADEPYSFGIVWEMLEDSDWLIPHVADQPFVEKPPLVYWIAASFAKGLPTLRPDEAARLAVLVFAALAIGWLYAAARRLYPEATAWRALLGVGAGSRTSLVAGMTPHAYGTLGLLLTVGTVGFAEHVHKLTADIGQLAGAVIGLCGIVYIGTSDRTLAGASASRRSAILGGLMLGTGAGIAFMSKGLLATGLLGVTCSVLLLVPVFRNRDARLAYGIATVAVVPWMVIWPALLHAASPELFGEWFFRNNVGRFLGSTLLGGNYRSLADKVASAIGAGFPAIVLCVYVAVRTARAAFREPSLARTLVREFPGHIALAVFLLVSLAVLATSASMRDVYLLPLLPAMVLLGLPALAAQSTRAPMPARFVVVLAFGVLLAIVVGIAVALATSGDLVHLQRLGRLLGEVLPLPFSLKVNAAAIIVAAVTIAGWVYIVRRDVLHSATVAWCAGFAMLWIVGAVLLLPWIDAARSYRGVFGEIAPQLSSSEQCVAALNLGESELAMLEYEAGIEAKRAYLGHSGSGKRNQPNPNAADCGWLIALSNQRSGAVVPDAQQWLAVRTVARPADRSERFTIYRARSKSAESEPPAVTPCKKTCLEIRATPMPYWAAPRVPAAGRPPFSSAIPGVVAGRSGLGR